MKKNIITAIFLGASMLAFSASAQTPQNSNSCAKCPETSVCPAGKADGKSVVPPGGVLPNFHPFIGTTITPEQQAKIEQLNKQRAEKRAATKGQCPKSRQACDSARRADKVEYLHQVRDIIGPDQYVIFLENIAVSQPQGKGLNPGCCGSDKAKITKGDRSKHHGDMKRDGSRHGSARHDKK